ncbi:Cof-type HAD-IIB family hydrolase [Lactiplantibacillus carotarum]|uniref:Cof-type HAD-IIB family hydrolase n=1 Tax=Lactiplantibacillus carotarum TaxID=2993456 RepID=UPI00298EE9DC|nr:Cof-type HAD-IIB family hydrolase [Lactiplantibacillus carotarum]
MNTIKLIVSDIDGTLVDDQGALRPTTIAGVQAAVAQGATMVLASARSPKGMFQLAQQLGIQSTMIAYNGALTAKTDAQDRLTVMAQQAIPVDLARQVQTLVSRQWPDASLNLYSNNDWLVTEKGPWEVQEAAGIGFAPTVTDLEAWLAAPQQPVHKILVMAASATIVAIERALAVPAFAGVTAYRSKDTYLEIVAAGVTKATALTELLRDDQLSPEQALAFGDNFNDVAMLQTVGIGVAMANAPQAVKQAADLVTTDNNHNGIQQILAQYFSREA